MHLRDLFVLAVVAITIPNAWRVPFAGLLTFSWLAYMRPQDLCWGFAKTARFSYLVAFVMIAGWFLHEFGRVRFSRWDVRTKIMAMLLVTIGISIPFARDQGVYVYDRYLEFCKIMFIALFTAGQVTSRARLRMMLWVITAALGFYGVKNGLFGLLKGGAPILHGPGGMLYDNNDFALALVMLLPMLFYMGRMEGKRWVRRLCLAGILLSILAILLTHSRGGFLSLCAVLFVLWLRGHKKLLGVGVVVAGAVAFFVFVPSHVIERIASIGEYEQDASARGRLMAWSVALNMIADYPVLGVGMHNFRPHFMDYIDGPISWAPVAHNSYLQIWAEGGSISFILYLILVASCFWTLRKLRRLGDRTPGGGWISDHARMFEASFVGFICGAMFLNRGHFDLVYHLMALITALNAIALYWVRQPEGAREGDPEDAEERRPLEVRRGLGRKAGPAMAVTRTRRPVWGR